jgi:hypothetical protein
MTYIGTVKKGVVVLPPDAKLPEGAEVMVELRKKEEKEQKSTKTSAADTQTLFERFKPFIGVFTGLPPDLAENHDHYLHGAPKKKK